PPSSPLVPYTTLFRSDHRVPGGLGSASASVDDASVGALAVVNAIGDVVGDDGRLLAGSTAPPDAPPFPDPLPFVEGEHTSPIARSEEHTSELQSLAYL